NALERKYVFCLSSATNRNYAKYIEGTAIGNTMSRVLVKEPEGDQAIRIVESKVSRIEGKFKNVFISYNAVEAAIDLSSKYMHDKYLPAKAIEILEKTAARISSEKKKNYICTKNDVAITVNEMTDIPTQDIEANEGEKLLRLEEEIHKYMIDQEEAVEAVADSLRRARVELREGKRPIASFLFMGPTGVGKTELAKTITRVYFGDKDYMIRLDMSEYQHQDSVEKMIGSSDNKGYLTEAVRKKPFSLILLDEFEKAHPKIFDLFLQVMDDGRLTDGEGRTIDFTNSIIIATSNAGSNYIQKEIVKGTNIEELKTDLINEHLNKIMRPELINRFDGLIVFKPLSRKDVVEIAKLMLKGVGKLLKEKGIFFEINEQGAAKLAEEGYDPKFGARPLRRLLQKKIDNEIAVKMLSGDIERRDTIVLNADGAIEVRKAKEL
ncbi:AAA domain-containing protein, partial [Candidatus Falkowbacteria bacterium]|nr:AAA domain-containing protein [Candidatus Falkowbacteria bacterium]